MALIPRYSDRGPTSSKEENERIRSHMTELNELYYEVNEALEQLSTTVFLGNVESVALNGIISDLESQYNNLSNASATQIVLGALSDNIVKDIITGQLEDPLGVLVSNPLYVDSLANVITLPQGSVTQKLKFYQDGVWYVNPEINLNHIALIDGVDPASTIPEDYAIDGDLSTGFFVEKTSDINGSGTLLFFVTIPANAGYIKDVNQITIYPAPSYKMTLQEIQYSSSTSYPINDDNPALWSDLSATYNVDDSESLVNEFLPPTHGGNPLQVLNAKTNLPITRYYIKRNPDTGDRYTALRILLSSEDLLVGTDYKVVLGIRQLDIASIMYGTSGTVWFKHTAGVDGFTFNSARPRVVNTDVVGVYKPECTGYYLDIDENLIEITDPMAFAEGETLYIKMEMDDGGSGDTPVIAGIILDIV